ncbi:hypothetical protein SLEP1_g25973 [Rubroshorea leprosula]|uniref:Uncharacterized protein n=1 Tax=Rubroshorea leprosula TaxID=152421 RepID=A0AAV5JR38_9ROSI|nr:hypothetical protein SLEP1_g25973 [Rubroshorea leprosula]
MFPFFPALNCAEAVNFILLIGYLMVGLEQSYINCMTRLLCCLTRSFFVW